MDSDKESGQKRQLGGWVDGQIKRHNCQTLYNVDTDDFAM